MSREPLTDQLREHVEALLFEHMIDAQYGEGFSPRAARRGRRVWLRPVRGRVSYYDALHELGHVVGVNARRRLDQEVLAWQWALENAPCAAQVAAESTGACSFWSPRRAPPRQRPRADRASSPSPRARSTALVRLCTPSLP
jgi:hypothetical protein